MSFISIKDSFSWKYFDNYELNQYDRNDKYKKTTIIFYSNEIVNDYRLYKEVKYKNSVITNITLTLMNYEAELILKEFYNSSNLLEKIIYYENGISIIETNIYYYKDNNKYSKEITFKNLKENYIKTEKINHDGITIEKNKQIIV
jgi:hypothetical protein